ncbi:MAG: hypothetical protein JOZ81_30905 [Chloroflexi bacterium]|nr:hypothetical protein [Chloroflexota bacterium]
MPIAVMTCIAIIGLVVDIGFFRLIDGELENAADAGALAAAWYDPVCPNDPTQTSPPQDPRCGVITATGALRTDNDPTRCPTTCAEYQANLVASKNLGLATALCGSTPTLTVSPNPPPAPLVNPSARGISVIIECDAPHVVGRIVGLNLPVHVIRWATAALGDDANPPGPPGTPRALGDYVAGSSAPLVVSLVPL